MHIESLWFMSNRYLSTVSVGDACERRGQPVGRQYDVDGPLRAGLGRLDVPVGQPADSRMLANVDRGAHAALSVHEVLEREAEVARLLQ